MHPIIDEDSGREHPYWGGMEIPERYRQEMKGNSTRKVRRAVRKAHRGLGRPRWNVLIKLLCLGLASKVATDYAKVWRCPVCAASQMPGSPHVASSSLPPFGFNETVVVDLMCVRDVQSSNYVALGMVDVGTGWHVALLLKKWQPRHVARGLIG